MVSQAMPCTMLCPWQACFVNVVIEWDQSLQLFTVNCLFMYSRLLVLWEHFVAQCTTILHCSHCQHQIICVVCMMKGELRWSFHLILMSLFFNSTDGPGAARVNQFAHKLTNNFISLNGQCVQTRALHGPDFAVRARPGPALWSQSRVPW